MSFFDLRTDVIYQARLNSLWTTTMLHCWPTIALLLQWLTAAFRWTDSVTVWSGAKQRHAAAAASPASYKRGRHTHSAATICSPTGAYYAF